jgi:hypothetical protein
MLAAATGVPLFYTDQISNNASSFITPATFSSESNHFWNMPPRSEQNPNGEHGICLLGRKFCVGAHQSRLPSSAASSAQ